jgi:D-alanine-D-alanine ligase-like ATP-grasp enzyme
MKKVKDLYSYENKYIAQGCKVIAGVDEAGRGP